MENKLHEPIIFFTFIAKRGENFWIEGVRKRKLPLWANSVPNVYDGFVKIEEQKKSIKVTLYRKDWSVLKTISVRISEK